MDAENVRVQCFERLEPSDVNRTQLAADYVPSHRNIFDVFVLNARLPLSADPSSQIENFGGELAYRPEGLLFSGGKPTSQSTAPPNRDHVLVNVYLQTEGPGGQPLLTLDRIAAAADHLSKTGEGRLARERGEYVSTGWPGPGGAGGVLGERHGAPLSISGSAAGGRNG